MSDKTECGARRGELVAIVRTTHDYVLGQGAQERTTVQLGWARSVSRQGDVLAVQPVDYEQAYKVRTFERVLTLPTLCAEVVDAYNARRYPSAPHSSMVPPFSSLDEARTFLRPFLTRELVSA